MSKTAIPSGQPAGQPSTNSSLLLAMRRGDKQAVKRYLDQHGAALVAAVRVLRPEGDPQTHLPEVLRGIWREAGVTFSPPASSEGERLFGLAVAASLLGIPDVGSARQMAVEPNIFAHIAARVHAGLGDADDAAIHADQCTLDERLPEAAALIRDAIAAGRAVTTADLPHAASIWQNTEAILR